MPIPEPILTHLREVLAHHTRRAILLYEDSEGELDFVANAHPAPGLKELMDVDDARDLIGFYETHLAIAEEFHDPQPQSDDSFPELEL